MSCLALEVSGEARITFPVPAPSGLVRMNCCLGTGGVHCVTTWIFCPVCWSVTIYKTQRGGALTEAVGAASASLGAARPGRPHQGCREGNREPSGVHFSAESLPSVRPPYYSYSHNALQKEGTGNCAKVQTSG